MAAVAKWWNCTTLLFRLTTKEASLVCRTFLLPSMPSYRTFPLCAFYIIALKPTSEPTGRVKYSAARKRLRCFSAVCSRHCWRVPQVQSRVDRWWQERRSRPNWLSLWDYEGHVTASFIVIIVIIAICKHPSVNLFTAGSVFLASIYLHISIADITCLLQLLAVHVGVIELATILKFSTQVKAL